MRSFDEILAKIAHDNGTTPEDVLHEMQVAIDDAYDHHDQEAQQLWDRMTFKGDRPTPEEFIFQVAMMLDEGNCITSFYSPSFLYRHKKTTPPVLEGPHSTWIYP